MSKQPTIVVTGAAGFIGSVFVQYLNEEGFNQLVLVDDFGVEEKKKELGTKTIHQSNRKTIFYHSIRE